MNKIESNCSPAYSGIKYQEPQSRYTGLSFVSGFGRSKRIWVLDYLTHNQSLQGQSHLGISECSSILFGLAGTFLNLAFRSILGQARAYFYIRLCRKDPANHLPNQRFEVR